MCMKAPSKEIYSKSTQGTSQNSITGSDNYGLKYSINKLNTYIKLHNNANMH